MTFVVDIVVEPDDEEFHAYCPALKGLHVAGDTREEALFNAIDAAVLYLESLIKHHDPIPSEVQVTRPKQGKWNPRGGPRYMVRRLQSPLDDFLKGRETYPLEIIGLTQKE